MKNGKRVNGAGKNTMHGNWNGSGLKARNQEWTAFATFATKVLALMENGCARNVMKRPVPSLRKQEKSMIAKIMYG
jgi:hypothetical protein